MTLILLPARQVIRGPPATPGGGAARHVRRAVGRLAHESWAVVAQHVLEVLDASVLNGLARAMLGLGKAIKAALLARRVLLIREAMLGGDRPKVACSRRALYEILLAQGCYAEAETLARHGLAIRARTHDERHPAVSISLDVLAQVREHRGDR